MAPGAAAQTAPPRRALIVGVDRARNEGVLKGAAREAESLAAYLTLRDVVAGDVRVLTDIDVDGTSAAARAAQPTRANIVNGLEWLFRTPPQGPHESLLFVYIGRPCTTARGAPAMCSLDGAAGGSIAFADVTSRFNASAWPRLTIIVDHAPAVAAAPLPQAFSFPNRQHRGAAQAQAPALTTTPTPLVDGKDLVVLSTVASGGAGVGGPAVADAGVGAVDAGSLVSCLMAVLRAHGSRPPKFAGLLAALRVHFADLDLPVAPLLTASKAALLSPPQGFDFSFPLVATTTAATGLGRLGAPRATLAGLPAISTGAATSLFEALETRGMGVAAHMSSTTSTATTPHAAAGGARVARDVEGTVLGGVGAKQRAHVADDHSNLAVDAGHPIPMAARSTSHASAATAVSVTSTSRGGSGRGGVLDNPQQRRQVEPSALSSMVLSMDGSDDERTGSGAGYPVYDDARHDAHASEYRGVGADDCDNDRMWCAGDVSTMTSRDFDVSPPGAVPVGAWGDAAGASGGAAADVHSTVAARSRMREERMRVQRVFAPPEARHTTTLPKSFTPSAASSIHQRLTAPDSHYLHHDAAKATSTFTSAAAAAAAAAPSSRPTSPASTRSSSLAAQMYVCGRGRMDYDVSPPRGRAAGPGVDGGAARDTNRESRNHTAKEDDSTQGHAVGDDRAQYNDHRHHHLVAEVDVPASIAPPRWSDATAATTAGTDAPVSARGRCLDDRGHHHVVRGDAGAMRDSEIIGGEAREGEEGSASRDTSASTITSDPSGTLESRSPSTSDCDRRGQKDAHVMPAAAVGDSGLRQWSPVDLDLDAGQPAVTAATTAAAGSEASRDGSGSVVVRSDDGEGDLPDSNTPEPLDAMRGQSTGDAAYNNSNATEGVAINGRGVESDAALIPGHHGVPEEGSSDTVATMLDGEPLAAYGQRCQHEAHEPAHAQEELALADDVYGRGTSGLREVEEVWMPEGGQQLDDDDDDADNHDDEIEIAPPPAPPTSHRATGASPASTDLWEEEEDGDYGDDAAAPPAAPVTVKVETVTVDVREVVTVIPVGVGAAAQQQQIQPTTAHAHREEQAWEGGGLVVADVSRDDIAAAMPGEDRVWVAAAVDAVAADNGELAGMLEDDVDVDAASEMSPAHHGDHDHHRGGVGIGIGIGIGAGVEVSGSGEDLEAPGTADCRRALSFRQSCGRSATGDDHGDDLEAENDAMTEGGDAFKELPAASEDAPNAAKPAPALPSTASPLPPRMSEDAVNTLLAQPPPSTPEPMGFTPPATMGSGAGISVTPTPSPKAPTTAVRAARPASPPPQPDARRPRALPATPETVDATPMPAVCKAAPTRRTTPQGRLAGAAAAQAKRGSVGGRTTPVKSRQAAPTTDAAVVVRPSRGRATDHVPLHRRMTASAAARAQERKEEAGKKEVRRTASTGAAGRGRPTTGGPKRPPSVPGKRRGSVPCSERSEATATVRGRSPPVRQLRPSTAAERQQQGAPTVAPAGFAAPTLSYSERAKPVTGAAVAEGGGGGGGGDSGAPATTTTAPVRSASPKGFQYPTASSMGRFKALAEEHAQQQQPPPPPPTAEPRASTTAVAVPRTREEALDNVAYTHPQTGVMRDLLSSASVLGASVDAALRDLLDWVDANRGREGWAPPGGALTNFLDRRNAERQLYVENLKAHLAQQLAWTPAMRPRPVLFVASLVARWREVLVGENNTAARGAVVNDVWAGAAGARGAFGGGGESAQVRVVVSGTKDSGKTTTVRVFLENILIPELVRERSDLADDDVDNCGGSGGAAQRHSEQNSPAASVGVPGSTPPRKPSDHGFADVLTVGVNFKTCCPREHEALDTASLYLQFLGGILTSVVDAVLLQRPALRPWQVVFHSFWRRAFTGSPNLPKKFTDLFPSLAAAWQKGASGLYNTHAGGAFAQLLPFTLGLVRTAFAVPLSFAKVMFVLDNTSVVLDGSVPHVSIPGVLAAIAGHPMLNYVMTVPSTLYPKFKKAAAKGGCAYTHLPMTNVIPPSRVPKSIPTSIRSEGRHFTLAVFGGCPGYLAAFMTMMSGMKRDGDNDDDEDREVEFYSPAVTQLLCNLEALHKKLPAEQA